VRNHDVYQSRNIHLYLQICNLIHNSDYTIIMGAPSLVGRHSEACSHAASVATMAFLKGQIYDTPVTMSRICAALNSPLNRNWIGATFALFGLF
jgi:hypothetical protein